MTITSKLPDVGTSIFAVMSALAAEHGAINLSQGFPDCDEFPAWMDADGKMVGGNPGVLIGRDTGPVYRSDRLF